MRQHGQPQLACACGLCLSQLANASPVVQGMAASCCCNTVLQSTAPTKMSFFDQNSAFLPVNTCQCAFIPCSVLPTPRKHLTEAQTAELIKVSALPPARKLQAYKAIIQRVLAPWSLFKQWGVSVGANFLQVRLEGFAYCGASIESVVQGEQYNVSCNSLLHVSCSHLRDCAA